MAFDSGLAIANPDTAAQHPERRFSLVSRRQRRKYAATRRGLTAKHGVIQS
jgi:hypothetical protein